MRPLEHRIQVRGPKPQEKRVNEEVTKNLRRSPRD